jgi:hypothetical protein
MHSLLIIVIHSHNAREKLGERISPSYTAKGRSRVRENVLRLRGCEMIGCEGNDVPQAKNVAAAYRSGVSHVLAAAASPVRWICIVCPHLSAFDLR